MRNDLLVLIPLLVAVVVSGTYHWPSPQFDQLEQFFYETIQEAGSAAITPSLRNCQPDPVNNNSVPATWIRFAYHGMSTHDVDTGLGGLDASIFLELDRDENVGAGMFTTSIELSGFSNKYISKADIVAMGVVFAMVSCDGPLIPFRGGRIDANVAGPFGVPQPQDSLASHTESFRRQGFTPSEMIGLVACGHTVGGVRNPDFPTLVPPSTTGEDNIVLFDTTPAYDNAIVTRYLDGSTQDRLVIDPNTTLTSDLRIFSSDQNVTMKKLSDPEVYQTTCADLMERMINTVPQNVTLTEEIIPIPAKVGAVQLYVGTDSLVLNATFRLLTPPSNPNAAIKMFWTETTGDACAQKDNCSVFPQNTTDVTSIITKRLGFSPVLKYEFSAPIHAGTSVSKFWFEVDNLDGTDATVYDNDGGGYEIAQDRILFDPGRSFHTFSSTFSGITLVVAARNDTLPSRVYINTYELTAIPSIFRTIDFAPDNTYPPSAGYNFYSASFSDNDQPFSFDLFGVVNGTTYSEDFRQSVFVQTFDFDF